MPSFSACKSPAHESSWDSGFLFYMWFQLLHFSPSAPASFSFLFTPLSFRSAKVLKTSQERPGQGSWHGAPYTMRGNFYPSDRATSDHILVRGPPPPARVVVWEEYIYLRVSTGHTQHTGLGAQKLKPPFKVHIHATSAGKPTEGFVCTECPQHSIWDPPRIFTVHELASW